MTKRYRIQSLLVMVTILLPNLAYTLDQTIDQLKAENTLLKKRMDILEQKVELKSAYPQVYKKGVSNISYKPNYNAKLTPLGKKRLEESGFLPLNNKESVNNKTNYVYLENNNAQPYSYSTNAPNQKGSYILEQGYTNTKALQTQTPTPLAFSSKSLKYSNIYLTGFGVLGYTDIEHGQSSFEMSRFNPTFIFEYQDIFMWESQLEFTINNDEGINTSIEYAYVDWFVNSCTTLMMGKFFTPTGRFTNTFYIPWFNKLPSEPVGFSDDGASPQTDIGIQFKGNYDLPAIETNYALFLANGPRVKAINGLPDHISSTGFMADISHRKVLGARVGFIPISDFEIGVSGSTGRIGIFNDGQKVDASRPYHLLGTDLNFTHCEFDLKAEYMQQQIASNPNNLVPGSAKWRAWYSQAAYKFLPSQWESVLRFGRFYSVSASQNQRQWAIGINYWFAPTIVGKLAYEVNSGLAATPTNANRVLFSFVYGF